MLRPNINVRVPLNINSDQSGRQNTQSVQTPQVEMSDTEKETKLNQIINDIQRGNISVDEAKSALEELGIIPEVTTHGNKTVFSFEFKGKQYTVNYVTPARTRSVLPQARGLQTGQLARISDLIEQGGIIDIAPAIIDVTPTIIDTPFTPSEPVTPSVTTETTNNDNGLYTLDDLQNKYNLANYDIQMYLKKDGNNYVIDKAKISQYFGRNDINTVEQLIDAMQNDGMLNGYLVGSFSQEQVNKYLTVNPNNPSKYMLNLNAIQADFPEQNIQTFGQLKEALSASGQTVDTVTSFSEQTYGKEFLTAVCQFTDSDLSRYFKLDNNTNLYTINQEYIKQIFPDKNINTVQDLINNLKDAKYSYYELTHCSMIHCLQYFTKNADGTYSFNNEAIKAKFPDKDIRTIGQLEAAYNGSDNTFELGDINNTSNLSYNDSYLKDYGFNDEVINDYFTKDSNGNYVLNRAMIHKRFPGANINNCEDLKMYINAHRAVYSSKEELLSYGLSDDMIENFFKENQNGTYSFNMDNLKYYFVDNKIPTTLTDLKNTNWYVAFEEQLSSSCKELDKNVSGTELLKYFEAFKNAMMFNWSENGVVSYGKTDLYDKDFMEKVFDALFANTGINALSEDEINKKAEEYRENLKKQYNIYTDAQIEEMVQNYINELKSQDTKTYNVRSIISQLSDDFQELRRGCYESTQLDIQVVYPRYYESGNSVGDCWTGTKADTGLTSKEILQDIIDGLDSQDYKTRFRSEMLMEKFNELGLSVDEMYYVMDIICKEYGIRKNTPYCGNSNLHIDLGDEPRYEGFNFLSLENSVNYNDFYNLLKVIEEKTTNIRHMDSEEIQAATTIDSNELFKNGNNLNAEYIYEHLNEMLLSNDPGVRKFAQQIYELSRKQETVYWYYEENGGGSGYSSLENFYKYHPDAEPTIETCDAGFYTKKETLDKIKWLITLLNEQAGVQNPSGNPSTTNVGLTPELLNKLGDNVFDEIEEVLNSQKFEKCLLANIDGIIGRFQQGSNGTGDCWLLSGIAAINATPGGQELLANSIKWNSDYTAITVTFPGTGDSVTITVDELLSADPDLGSGKYNLGDNDVLAIVLAYEKLYGEINGDNGDTFFKKFLPNANHNRESAGGVDDAFAMVGSVFGGGGRVDLPIDDVYDYLIAILEAKQRGENVAATFCLFTGGDTTYRWTCVGGEQHECNLDHGGTFDWGGHVFAITNVERRNNKLLVTFVNPWDSDKEYTVFWDEFAKIGIAQMAWSTW